MEFRKELNSGVSWWVFVFAYLEITVISMLKLRMAQDERTMAHVSIRILVGCRELTTVRQSIVI